MELRSNGPFSSQTPFGLASEPHASIE